MHGGRRVAAARLGRDAARRRAEAHPLAAAGTPTGPATSLPMRHRGEVVGTLRVTARPGRRAAHPGRRAAGHRCDQVAPAVAALRLSDRLQQSRAALVTAREEERRRLRRDLHDGVGAALAGVRLQVESARDLVDRAGRGGLLRSAAGRRRDRRRRRAGHHRRPAPRRARRPRARGRPARPGRPDGHARHRDRRWTSTCDGAAAGGGRGRVLPDRGRGTRQRDPARRRPPGRRSPRGDADLAVAAGRGRRGRSARAARVTASGSPRCGSAPRRSAARLAVTSTGSRHPGARRPADGGPMTRILLVDDHPLFLDGVRAALTGADDLEVVGEAHDVARGVALAAELEPDVVLMDLNLPDGSGSTRPARILAATPDVRVLVMTMAADDDAVVAAMRAGARGYVVKGAGREELLHAVRTVAAGGAVFSPTVADRLGRYFAGMAAGAGQRGVPPADRARDGGPRPGRPRPRQPAHRPRRCSSPTRPCATTCRTCSPSSGSRTGPRRSPGRGPPASGADGRCRSSQGSEDSAIHGSPLGRRTFCHGSCGHAVHGSVTTGTIEHMFERVWLHRLYTSPTTGQLVAMDARGRSFPRAWPGSSGSATSSAARRGAALRSGTPTTPRLSSTAAAPMPTTGRACARPATTPSRHPDGRQDPHRRRTRTRSRRPRRPVIATAPARPHSQHPLHTVRLRLRPGRLSRRLRVSGRRAATAAGTGRPRRGGRRPPTATSPSRWAASSSSASRKSIRLRGALLGAVSPSPSPTSGHGSTRSVWAGSRARPASPSRARR